MPLLIAGAACVLVGCFDNFGIFGDHQIEWNLPCPLNHCAIDRKRQGKGFAVLIPVAANRWIGKDLLQ